MRVGIAAGFAAVVFAGAILLSPSVARAQDLQAEIDVIVKNYLATHPDEVGQIAKQYFIEHPEAVNEILAELLKRHRQQQANAGPQPAAPAKAAPDQSAAVAKDASALFSSPHQVTLGDQGGDVTLVEFFDYNCGYCRHALSDMTGLLTADPKLKVVLKEFPILGEGSVEAARVAIAVRMQDPSKYLAFHEALLGGRGPANKETALAAAKSAGLDTARIETDMESDEIKTTLEEDAKLARDLALSGTPSYVIGKNVVVGAVGMAALDDQIKAARTR
jgi:protein-disulfide isomerase